MTDPNAAATPESVSDQLAGTDGGGVALPFEKVAMFYDAHMFGLSKDYAFPEGSNTSPALPDHASSLAKLLTRKQKLSDGNDYDLWDCVFTITKWILMQSETINNNEVNSVNFKPGA